MFKKVAGSVTGSVTGLEYCRLAVQPSRSRHAAACFECCRQREGRAVDATRHRHEWCIAVYCLNVCQRSADRVPRTLHRDKPNTSPCASNRLYSTVSPRQIMIVTRAYATNNTYCPGGDAARWLDATLCVPQDVGSRRGQ